jgi:hypothetical protein
MSFSPERSCASSGKESQIDNESESDDEHLRNERMLLPLLTGPSGAPRMLPDSSGTVFGLPSDHAIHGDVLFEMPPAISMEKDVATVTEHKHDDDTDRTFNEYTIGRGADSVLESTFENQSKAGDDLTHTILHWRQQKSSLEGKQQQQETANSMEQQADTTLLRWTTRIGAPFPSSW